MIADEVVTGFGRSGAMFGSRGWGEKPDIMVCATALTAGYVPLFGYRAESAECIADTLPDRGDR